MKRVIKPLGIIIGFLIVMTLLIVIAIKALAFDDSYKWKQKDFVISTFHAVPGVSNGYYNEILSKTKEANFTHVETTFTSRESSLLILNICDSLGLKVIVQDYNLFGGYQDLNVPPTTEQDVIDAINLYGKHPSLAGYYIWDEPYLNQFSLVRQNADWFMKHDPSRLLIMGAQQSASPSYKWYNGTFKNYIDNFVSTIDPPIIISNYSYFYCDVDKGIALQNSDFWDDIGYLRKKALTRDVPLWYYAQLVDNMTVDRARFELYTLLTYGTKGISYYNSLEGIVDDHGVPNNMYDGIKSLNGEVLQLGKTLVNLKSTLVYHTGYVKGNYVDSISSSQVVSSAPTGLEFGEFESPKGGKYILMTNRNYNSSFSGTVTLKNNYKIYKVSKTNGLVELVSENANSIALNLIAGSGELFIFTGLNDAAPEDFAQKPQQIKYTFDSGTEGWDIPYFMNEDKQLALSQENGALKCQMLTGWRPITVQSYLGTQINGADYNTVHIRLKNPTAATEAQLGFSYASDPTMLNLEDTGYNIPFAISANDTEYKDYYIRVGNNQYWSSKTDITFLRVQLCLDAVAINQSVYIDSIKIYYSPPEVSYNFNSDIEGWAAPYFMASAGQLAITQESGSLKCKMLTGWRAITAQVSLDSPLDGSVYNTVHIRIKNPTAATQAKIGFGYVSDPDMTNLEVAEYNFQFTISANDTEYKDYYINLGNYQNWATKNDINFFRVQLCVDVATINQSVYIDAISIYNKILETFYDFNSGTQGFDAPYFIVSGGQLAITAESGSLKCQMLTGWRAITVQAYLDNKLDGSIYNTVHLRIKNPTAATQAKIGFGYASDPDMVNLESSSYNIPFSISANDTGYKDYYIHVGNNEEWYSKTDINFFRVQLCLDTVSINQAVYIDSIKIYHEMPPVVFGVTEKGTTGKVFVNFNEGTAILNGNIFENGTEVNKTGSYNLLVCGNSNNITTVRFFVVIYGDLNGDGNINALDMVTLKKHLLKSSLIQGVYFSAGDIYKSGTISIRDLILIKKHILGITSINNN